VTERSRTQRERKAHVEQNSSDRQPVLVGAVRSEIYTSLGSLRCGFDVWLVPSMGCGWPDRPSEEPVCGCIAHPLPHLLCIGLHCHSWTLKSPRQCKPGPSASDASTLRGLCLQNVAAALFSRRCYLLYKVPAKSLPGTLLAGVIRGFNVHSRRIVPMLSRCIDWPCSMY